MQGNVGLFGSLVMSVDGRPVGFTSPGERDFVATLSMNAGRPVSLNKICRAVWGKDYSPEMESALRPLVTRSRKRLGIGRDLIVTGPSTYRLVVAADDVDILAFQSRMKEGLAAYAAGNWETCLKRLDGAGAIWTDEPFADIRSPYLRDQHLDSLYARRSLLIPRRTEAFIRASSPRCADEVIHDVNCLIRDTPGDDHYRWLRMLALYRSGNPSGALDEYSYTHSYLITKYGREPSQELKRLHEWILKEDPRLLQTPFVD